MIKKPPASSVKQRANKQRAGVHSIPEMHALPIEMFCWPYGQSLKEAWSYAAGKTKPNYPLPVVNNNPHDQAIGLLYAWSYQGTELDQALDYVNSMIERERSIEL